MFSSYYISYVPQLLGVFNKYMPIVLGHRKFTTDKVPMTLGSDCIFVEYTYIYMQLYIIIILLYSRKHTHIRMYIYTAHNYNVYIRTQVSIFVYTKPAKYTTLTPQIKGKSQCINLALHWLWNVNEF